MSQIFKFMYFTKAQKSRERDRERNNIFSSDKKFHQLHICGYFKVKSIFVAEAPLTCATDDTV